ncbi:13721_t:CDS:2, partial [Racocetra fulgida]
GAYDLPENPSPLEKMKYDICQNILGYKLTNHSTTQQIAQQIQLSIAETEELLFCRIEKFTLDRLVVYASKLFSPSHIKITNNLILEILEQKLHAQKVNPMSDSHRLWGKDVFL